MGMSKQPKEIRDIEKQLKVTTIAVRDLHARAMELGLKDIEESAGKAHDELLDCALARNAIVPADRVSARENQPQHQLNQRFVDESDL
jgi:hypothetical protein